MNVSELPALIGGRYRPIRKLGEGSMGFVFEVEHTRTLDRLALKVMRTHAGPLPAVVERFKREARTAARIKSEHIVRVIDADIAPELGDVLYLVMELLDGTDLERACGDTPQPPSLVVEWMRQAAHGLDKAHALGIVHRDLKPENLFLTQGEHGEPRVKILDFGVAKTLEDAPGTTQTGQLLGTPLFMSPEHARASGDIGPAADRYALGLVAYRLLVGRDYWIDAPNVAGIIAQILYEPMASPSARGVTFGPEFDASFARACHRDPEQRFQTSADLVEELARALGVAAKMAGPSIGPSLLVSAPVQREAVASSAGTDTSLAPTLGSAISELPSRRSRAHRTRWLAAAVAIISAAAVWRALATAHSERAPEQSAAAAAAVTAAPGHPPSAEVAPAAMGVSSAEAVGAAANPDSHPRAAPPISEAAMGSVFGVTRLLPRSAPQSTPSN